MGATDESGEVMIDAAGYAAGGRLPVVQVGDAEPGSGAPNTTPRPAEVGAPPSVAGPPSSVSTLALERLAQSRAVSRRSGNRAEVATLRAQLQQAHVRGETESERALAAKLARALVRRGSSLGEATKLARRSLLLGDDPVLREELSAWFAGIGELSLAAGTLEALTDRPVAKDQLAALWLRIAVLRARASEGRSAMQALRAAFDAEPTNPLPLELLAALRGWAPELVTAARAGQALLEAARRRKARGDERGALEDLLRALEADPHSKAITERLGQHLADAGKLQAADEVWRSGADPLGASSELTQRRVLEALGASDPALALAATLDAKADTRLEQDTLWTAASIVEGGAGQVPVPNFDGLLSPLGLQPWLAARLLWLAETQSGEARAHSLVSAAGLLCAAHPQQAGGLLADALDAHPESEEVLKAFESHSAHSAVARWRQEALVRSARSGAGPSSLRHLEELAQAANNGKASAQLGLWALAELEARGGVNPDDTQRWRQLKFTLSAAAEPVSAWQRHSHWDRLSLAELRRVVESLAYQPDLAGQYAEALFEMQRREPDQEEHLHDLERVLGRLGRFDELERLWLADLGRAEPFAGSGLGLMRLYVRQAAPEKAFGLLQSSAARFGFMEMASLAALTSLHGRPEQRATGFELLAPHVTTAVRSVLYCVASETALEQGAREGAFRFAEFACHANPRAARPVVCLAHAVGEGQPRVAALALERACEMVVPRGRYCRALVSLAEQSHDAARSRRWAQRWLSLNPLLPEAGRTMLERWMLSSDAAALGKGLDWWLSQPRPRPLLAAEFAGVLLRLAELDAERSKAFLQRVLGAFGVGEPALTRVLSELSESLAEPALRVAVLERQLAADPDLEPIAHLLELSDLHTRAGDGDAAADALARALEQGANIEEVRVRLPHLPALRTSDGQLAKLHCRTQCLLRDGTEPSLAIEALRELGATYWDLSGDRDKALAAWERAAELDKDSGDESLAQDLIAFCGYADAVPTLQAMAAKRTPERAGRLLLAGAGAALRDGFGLEAATLAVRALDNDPHLMGALAVLERAAPEQESALLEQAYSAVSQASLGVFGARALHYRAARQQEKRRQYALALEHAVLAFEAVPAEGVAYALMLRLASHLGQETRATLALRRVAERTAHAGQRAHWLELAARTAGPGVDGLRLKVDVLLRSLTVRPELDQVLRLGEALQAALQAEPKELESWAREFDGALRSLLRGLDEPRDVPVALAAGRLAIALFASATQCAAALDRAVQLDPSSAAWQGIEELAVSLNGRSSAARRVLDAVFAAQREGQEPCQPLLSLAFLLAEQHAVQRLAELAVARALSEPLRAEWIQQAQQLAAERPELLAQLAQAMPREQRLKRFWERVARLEHASPVEALELLEQHREAAWLSSEEQHQVWLRRVELSRTLKRTAQLEQLLMQGIEAPHPSASERRHWALELCQILAGRAAHAAALDVLGLVASFGELQLAELQLGAQIARTSGDRERELTFLEPQEALPSTPEARRALWQRLWELHEELGQTRAAGRDAERLLELDPSNAEAHRYLLTEAERQQDHPRLVKLLEDRLLGSVEPGAYLQLAAAYAQTLGQREQAVATLERGLAACAEQQSLLQPLSEQLRALGKFSEAGAALERAGALSDQPQARAEYAALAARAYLDASQDAEARRVLSAHPETEDNEELAALRVQLARRSGPPEALGVALERAAAQTSLKPLERAAHWCEAAEVALVQGDLPLALQRAQQAARLAPRQARAQLLARRIEYLERGAGTSANALTTIGELRGLGELADAVQSALQSFLLAEALDQRVGLGAGQRELEEYGRRHAADPLVSLGLAERYASRGKHELALPLFEQAIEQPERWYGLRELAAVLKNAAQCAEAAGDEERKVAWTQRAEQLVSSGAPARTLSSNPPAVSAPAPEELATVAAPLFAVTPPEASAAAGSSGEVPAAPEPTAPAEASPAKAEPAAAAPIEAEPAVAAPVVAAPVQPEPVARVASASKRQPPAKPQVRSNTVSSGTLPVVTPRPRMSTDPGLGALQALATPPVASPTTAVPATTSSIATGKSASGPHAEVQPAQVSAEPRTVTERPAAASAGAQPSGGGVLAAPVAPAQRPTTLSQAPPSSALSVTSAADEEAALTRPSLFAPAEPALSGSIPPDSEERLMLALRQGNLAAGEQLLQLWSDSPQKVHDRVNVHRLIVAQRPGDAAALERLLHAVVEGNDIVYQTALRHALLVHFDPARAPAPPPLAHQAMQPDALLSLLCGPTEPVLEVLSLLWQTASHLLRVAEPPPVGAKRLTSDTLTPLGQLSTTLSRLFGAARVQVYHQLGPRPVQLRLVLEQPMRLMVVGPDLADIPEFRFHFGSMLLAARPEYALLYGLAEADVRELLGAAVAAFGPPGKVRGPATEVVAYAGRLWESVPARVQRRLQELTTEPELIEYGRAFQATNTALWRAGLFAAGDLAVAVLQVCAQEGLDRTRLAMPGGLQLLCEDNARLAAIVRFGTSVEYAEARWRPLRSASSAGHRGSI